jgi:hypothetical protein
MGIQIQPNGSFKANIMIDRKKIHIGYFITYQKAYKEYSKLKEKAEIKKGRKVKKPCKQPTTPQ